MTAIVCISCDSKTDIYKSPEKVTEKFIVAFYTADFENMYKLSVPHTQPLIRNLQKSMRNNPERLKTMNANHVEVQNIKCEYINDTLAMCSCQFTCENQPKKTSYRAKKMDGKWLVDISED